ncbi:MAG: hypothetical protein J6M62_09215, partial [Selenomonadaceae bacterium]|nr:hypothetical protein [Selenomonadaceae bacterium]
MTTEVTSEELFFVKQDSIYVILGRKSEFAFIVNDKIFFTFFFSLFLLKKKERKEESNKEEKRERKLYQKIKILMSFTIKN